MENLNAEQIKKALGCCHTPLASDCNDCGYRGQSVENGEYIGCSNRLMADALSLIKELTEENERLRAEQTKIKRKVLMEAASKFAGHSDYHGDAILCKLICMAEGKEVGVANPIDEVRKKETQTDTVRKMHSEIKERCIKGGIYPAFVASTIDQIAKEMLEGG